MLEPDDTSRVDRFQFTYQFTHEIIECTPGAYPPRQSLTHQRLGFFCLWPDSSPSFPLPRCGSASSGWGYRCLHRRLLARLLIALGLSVVVFAVGISSRPCNC